MVQGKITNAPTNIQKFEHLSSSHPSGILQLSRLTLLFTDTSQNPSLNTSNSYLAPFDILAVRPTNEKAYNAACTNLEVDIISIDMGVRLPWYFKRTMTGVAIKRGVVFEIAYSGAIRDSSARRHLISNAQSLIRVTKGKGIIISSEAQKALEIRGPHDIVNMASTLFGMSTDAARDAISTNARQVLYHAATRIKTAKAVISIASKEPTSGIDLNPPAWALDKDKDKDSIASQPLPSTKRSLDLPDITSNKRSKSHASSQP